MATPAEGYSFGTQYLTTNIGKLLLTPLTALLYFPVLYKMQLISPFQYLEEIFSYTVRWVESFISCISSIILSGLTIYIRSLALESLINLSVEYSILLLNIICAFYSTLGGIKGVIYYDVFQFIIFTATLFVICIKYTIDEGGIINIHKTENERNRL